MNINISSNDTFSKFSEIDKKELILYLEQFYLTYREQLGFLEAEEITFGLELEFEYCLVENIEKLLDNNNLIHWLTKHDRSLNSGGEINSPILKDNLTTWKELKIICNILKENHVSVTENCGGHIHFGSILFGNNYENWLTLIKCWIAFEKVLFRFGYGETDKARRPINRFAAPLSFRLQEFINSNNIKFTNISIEQYISLLKERTCRRCAINFQNINLDYSMVHPKNTIEFRFPNGTIEEIIWQNNVNTIGKMLLAIKTNKIDIEWLNNYIANNKMHTSSNAISLYDNIYLLEALSFVDMVFDNNLDKLYFLRQYLKNYNKEIYAERQKKFIIN